MKKGKSLITTGLVVAAVMVAGVSVYAASDVVEETVETVRDKTMFGKRADRGQGGQGGSASRDYSFAVEEGILTQAEADDIMAYMEEKKTDWEAVREATEDLTREEAKAYMEENYDKVDLVEEGLLTEEQKEELQALRPEKSEDARSGKGNRGSKGNNFEGAVEAGIVSQEEADVILAYIEDNRPNKEDLEEELEGLSREEARTYMEENYQKIDLVDVGLLTEAQMEQLQELREEAGASRERRNNRDSSDSED